MNQPQPTKCVVVGISGPSGSGKTSFASALMQKLQSKLGAGGAIVISEDFYYKDQAHVPVEQRVLQNYDHPGSLDHTYLAEHLAQLRAGQSVHVPQYDFCTHTRASAVVEVTPRPVVIVEGILILASPELRRLMDYRIFIDTPLDVCFLRRARRDRVERGRTFESIALQWQSTVRPMYMEFTAPSRECADLAVPGLGDSSIAVEILAAAVKERVRQL